MALDKIEFADWVLAGADHGNDWLLSEEAIDMIQEYVPDISWDSAQQQIKSYVLPLNAAIGVLKKTTEKQKVQATTSNRTNINAAQQYHLHWAVNEVYEYLRRETTRLCQLTGKHLGRWWQIFLLA